jgi:hypothetical protein
MVKDEYKNIFHHPFSSTAANKCERKKEFISNLEMDLKFFLKITEYLPQMCGQWVFIPGATWRRAGGVRVSHTYGRSGPGEAVNKKARSSGGRRSFSERSAGSSKIIDGCLHSTYAVSNISIGSLFSICHLKAHFFLRVRGEGESSKPRRVSILD